MIRLISFMRKQMQISRPFLFILACVLCIVLGSTVTYMFKDRQVSSLKENISELRQEFVRKESHWMKQIKEAKKRVIIKNVDGSEKIIETENTDTNSSGHALLDVSKIDSKLINRAIDYSSYPWTLTASYGLNMASERLYKVEIGRDVFSRFTLGGFSVYDGQDVWLGISVGYKF